MQVGDAVIISCDSGFCNTIHSTVHSLYKRYDENTGKWYYIICCFGKWKFDSRTLQSIKSPTMYSVEKL